MAVFEKGIENNANDEVRDDHDDSKPEVHVYLSHVRQRAQCKLVKPSS
jgi:hypothetical protein